MSLRLSHLCGAQSRACGSVFRGRSKVRAFTLLELLATLAVLGLLAAIALPTYTRIMDKQKTGAAVRDLMRISIALERYRVAHVVLPDSLSDIDMGGLKDPWGNPYQYLNFEADIPGIKGKIRKDHNLHPINSNFDLYSSGPDGESKPPLTAKASRDDIIFAGDGSFIGRAEDF